MSEARVYSNTASLCVYYSVWCILIIVWIVLVCSVPLPSTDRIVFILTRLDHLGRKARQHDVLPLGVIEPARRARRCEKADPRAHARNYTRNPTRALHTARTQQLRITACAAKRARRASISVGV